MYFGRGLKNNKVLKNMKDVYDFIKNFDMHTIIVVGIAFWWINGNVKELNEKISSRIDSLSVRIDGLTARVDNLSERVARIEGILTNRNMCVTKSE